MFAQKTFPASAIAIPRVTATAGTSGGGTRADAGVLAAAFLAVVLRVDITSDILVVDVSWVAGTSFWGAGGAGMPTCSGGGSINAGCCSGCAAWTSEDWPGSVSWIGWETGPALPEDGDDDESPDPELPDAGFMLGIVGIVTGPDAGTPGGGGGGDGGFEPDVDGAAGAPGFAGLEAGGRGEGGEGGEGGAGAGGTTGTDAGTGGGGG
ncbi:MAG TPA: hypothetical protein VMS89_03555 [Methanoregulaceae archaeon]|nr:hypothetical protein [Methanoregulaceae archaeon]